MTVPKSFSAYWWRPQTHLDTNFHGNTHDFHGNAHEFHGNFGDELTPLLLKHFSGIDVFRSAPADAQIVCVGSVLEALSANYSGLIVGAGKMFEATDIKTLLNIGTASPSPKIMGLRGRLTAQGVDGDFVLGDPGLLANELVAASPGLYNLGIVPHWSDKELAKRFAQYNPLIIRPGSDPKEVVRAIGSCKKIVSSSLHGIIVADSFGIPRRAELFPRAQREGGDFKFRDYSSILDEPIEFGTLQCPSRWVIEGIQEQLFEMFRKVGTILRENE